MITILEKLEKGKLKSFRTITWKSSNKLPDNSTETFWLLKTNFRLHTLIEHWKFSWFLGRLDETLVRSLIDFSSVLRDEMFCALLRAKLTEIPTELLLKRYNFLLGLSDRSPWTLESFNAREGDLKFEIKEIRKPIRKVKKFSGYIKSPSSVRSSRNKLTIPDPEIFEWSKSQDLDFYEFLTVGRFSGTSVEISILS